MKKVKLTQEPELWKSINGYEGIYEVSNCGNVRSLDRFYFGKGGKRVSVKGRNLTPSVNGAGYLQVGFSVKGDLKNHLLHRIIVSAFIPNPEDKETVNHIDGNKLNNCISNLEWATRQENNQRAYDLGLNCSSLGKRVENKGENHASAKLTENDVRYIRRNSVINGGEKGYTELSKMFGVGIPAIRSVALFEKWKHVPAESFISFGGESHEN